MISSILLFIAIPVGLVIVAEALIRKRSASDAIGRHSFLFLAWIGVGLASIITISYLLLPPMGYGIPNLLAPVLAGVVAITLLHWQTWKQLGDRERTVLLSTAGLLTVLILGQFVIGRFQGNGRAPETLLLGLAVAAISILLAIIWWVGKHRPVLIGMLAILYMLAFNGLEGGSLPFFDETSWGWLSIATAAVYVILPGIVIASIMVLVFSAFHRAEVQGEANTFSSWSAAGRLLFALALLGLFIYTIVWLCIWDGTDDGVRGVFMLMLSILTAVAGGMVISMTSEGWRRWTGVAAAILVIGLVRWAVAVPGTMYRPYDITEARASQIQAALEKYHAKTSWYPFQLSDLVPGQLWRIPLPMIMPNEDWCYQGGSNYYRLGTIYREHWSSPYLSIKTYASAGPVPEGNWICDEKLADLLSRQNLEASQSPVSTPLPTSEVAAGRTVVEPIFHAPSLVVGDWSSDGRYLVFGESRLTGEAEEPIEIDVKFLDAQTGAICASSRNPWRAGKRSDGLNRQHVWLPDGHLLYVSNFGEMAIITPCAGALEDLTDRYTARFTEVISFDANGRHTVLKSQDSYWLLDHVTLEIEAIPDISPATLDNERDWMSWSPDGDRLAISQLIGQGASAEAAIFVVNGVSGLIERRIPLTGDSETVDGPIVDWLSSDELLVQFANSLLILDLSSDPAQVTDLVRDIFLLDVSYPFDFSSMDFIRDVDEEAYAIIVRANHQHNQDSYLFDSQTGQVNVFRHDVDTLLFFPGGQWLQAPKLEDPPSYRTEYEVVWMDHPDDNYRLVVDGHTPRNNPQIFPKYLPTSSQLMFSSSQGISLVSLPNGKTTQFWELAGNQGASIKIFLSPQEDVIVALLDGVGLYLIPLSSK